MLVGEIRSVLKTIQHLKLNWIGHKVFSVILHEKNGGLNYSLWEKTELLQDMMENGNCIKEKGLVLDRKSMESRESLL